MANSPYTVLGDSMSAGRLSAQIGDRAAGKVIIVTPQGVLCKLCKKSLLKSNETDESAHPLPDLSPENGASGYSEVCEELKSGENAEE